MPDTNNICQLNAPRVDEYDDRVEYDISEIRMGDDKFPHEIESEDWENALNKDNQTNQVSLEDSKNLHDYFIGIVELQNDLEREVSTISKKESESETERSLYLVRNYENFLKKVNLSLQHLVELALGFETDTNDEIDIAGLELSSNLMKYVYVLNKRAPTFEQAYMAKGTYKDQLIKITESDEFKRSLMGVGADITEISQTKIDHALHVVNRDQGGRIKKDIGRGTLTN
jgi:hypothetical protein